MWPIGAISMNEGTEFKRLAALFIKAPTYLGVLSSLRLERNLCYLTYILLFRLGSDWVACIRIYVPLHSLGGYVFVAKSVFCRQKVGYSVIAYFTASEHFSNEAWIHRDVLANKVEFRLWLKNTTPQKSQPLGFVEKAISSGTEIADFWCRPFFWKSLLNLLQHCCCSVFVFFGHEACGILASQSGIEPAPQIGRASCRERV